MFGSKTYDQPCGRYPRIGPVSVRQKLISWCRLEFSTRRWKCVEYSVYEANNIDCCSTSMFEHVPLMLLKMPLYYRYTRDQSMSDLPPPLTYGSKKE